MFTTPYGIIKFFNEHTIVIMFPASTCCLYALVKSSSIRISQLVKIKVSFTFPFGEEINIATQKEITIGGLAEELIRQINPEAGIVCDEERLRPEKSEVNKLLGCNEKIMRLTSWKPRYSLEAGLRETITFLKENLDRYKTDIYNL